MEREGGMKLEERPYRDEYKYPLTNGQNLLEESKIKAIALKDGHVGEKGYYNIFLPQVTLMHFESKTRGLDTTTEKFKRLQ